MASLLGAGFAVDAMALDLYVDQKTQQIFAEPGKGRTKLGTFQQVDENAAPQKPQNSAQQVEINQIKDDLATKTSELKALDERISDPTLGKVRMGESGVKWESADGQFDVQLNGRIQLDSQMSMNQSGVHGAPGAATTQLADGTSIRRARLSAEGHMFKEFGYKFEYDFDRGNGYTAGGITEAWMNWNGYSPLTLTVGQFKEPISLEEATSDIQTSFIERNMAINAFIDNNNVFKMGTGLRYAQPRYTVQTAFQTETIGNSTGSDTSAAGTNGNSNRNGGQGDTGWGITGRVTGLPWFEDKSHLLHVGAAGSQRNPNINPSAANFASGGPGSGAQFGSQLGNVDRSLILNTGVISTANGKISTQTVTRGGGEAAFVYGPVSVQGEYLQAQVAGNGLQDNTLRGYYTFASLFLTGESRNYNDKMGIFDRIKPAHNFSTNGGGFGAWELLTGYDYLDMNSGIIHGGRADSGKVGLNWYPNSRMRVMANFVHVFDLNTYCTGYTGICTGAQAKTQATSQSGSFNGHHPDIFEIRTQLDF